MKLRELRLEDALEMIKWMHDPVVVKYLNKDFSQKTIEDCRAFISHCNDSNNLHLAIVDDCDLYRGTVSLKNINSYSAEFSITIGRSSMGCGVSKKAMFEMLTKGFIELGLTYIYWCVSPSNSRAIEFYDKNHFKRVNYSYINGISGYSDEQITSYIWYKIDRNDLNDLK